MRVLLVGGGGNYTELAGAGSGYIEYLNMPVTDPSYHVELRAGDGTQASLMTIISNGETLFSGAAAPGGNSYQGIDDFIRHGGDGYSGGKSRLQSSFFDNLRKNQEFLGFKAILSSEAILKLNC